jgi:hypothetical protein
MSNAMGQHLVHGHDAIPSAVLPKLLEGMQVFGIRALASVFLAVLLVGLTSCGEVTVASRSQLAALWFGFPLPYLMQDQAFFARHTQYPFATRFGSPYSDPWEFLWAAWLVDVAFFMTLIVGFQLVIHIARHHAGPSHVAPRRALRALGASVALVLLAGLVLVVGEYLADAHVRAAERAACLRAYEYRSGNIDPFICPPYPSLEHQLQRTG